MFHNDGEGGNDRSAEKRARNQIGVYVRVFGNVSVGQNSSVPRHKMEERDAHNRTS